MQLLGGAGKAMFPIRSTGEVQVGGWRFTECRAMPRDRSFAVLKTIGGCGGTIVSRCLAATGMLVLSEVNPRSASLFGGALNPLEQIKRYAPEHLPIVWREADYHSLGDPLTFGRFLTDLVDSVRLPIVVRDYSFVDYIGVPFVWPVPTQVSMTAALRPYGRAQVALLVRHPADCYKSLLSHPLLADLSPEVFVNGHLAMCDDHIGCRTVRFEDFLADPVGTVDVLCTAMHLPLPKQFSIDLSLAPALTGHGRATTALTVEKVAKREKNEIDEMLGRVPGYDRLLGLNSYVA